MYKLPAILVIGLCVSCTNPSPLAKKLKSADSLVITFNQPDTDSVINAVSTTEANAIKKITGFLGGKTREGSPCGFDGHLDFFSRGQLLQQVVFSYHTDSCRQFIFDFDNQVQTLQVSNEARNFLQSLGEGKNWY